MKIFTLLSFVILPLLVNAAAFTSTPLPADLQNQLIASEMWSQDCPVSLQDLRLINVNYYDLSGQFQKNGQLIVAKQIAPITLTLFKKFYAHKMPITGFTTLANTDWQTAEKNNQSYGFDCHKNSHGQFVAESFGTVLTLNPVQNPEFSFIDPKPTFICRLLPNLSHCVGAAKQVDGMLIFPPAGVFAMNRSLNLSGQSESFLALLQAAHFARLRDVDHGLNWDKFIYSINKLEPNVGLLASPPAKLGKPTYFSSTPLTPTIEKELIKNDYWQEGCPVPLNRLNVLTISYYDFQQHEQTGQIVVFDAAAPFVLAAFQKLYAEHYPLEHLYVINNTTASGTGAFYCRAIRNGTNFSLHAYGLAVDINPAHNPYIGGFKLMPDGSMQGQLLPNYAAEIPYLDRANQRPGMNESIVKLMASVGFIEWGGQWQTTLDYMHFQVPENIAKNLSYMDKTSGEQLMVLVIRYPAAAEKMSDDVRWKLLYQLYPTRYMTALTQYFPLLTTEDEKQIFELMLQKLSQPVVQ